VLLYCLLLSQGLILGSARCFLASAAGGGGAEGEDGAPAGGGPALGRFWPCRFGRLLS
jgi:hypothetical protein